MVTQEDLSDETYSKYPVVVKFKKGDVNDRGGRELLSMIAMALFAAITAFLVKKVTGF